MSGAGGPTGPARVTVCVPGCDAAGPLLLAVGHGSRSPHAAVTLAALVDRAAARRPNLSLQLGWLDHTSPLVEDVVAELVRPAVALPLLLHTGWHVTRDLPDRFLASAGGRWVVAIAQPLGTHPLVIEAGVDRVLEVARGRAERVVLAVAGSGHPAALVEVAAVARAIDERLGLAALPSVATDAASVSRTLAALGPGAVVLRWFIAQGRMASAVAAAAAAVSAPYTDVLGPHPGLVQALLDRYDEAVLGTAAP